MVFFGNRITGGELFDKITEIGAYSEHTAAELVANIVSAVGYLHSLQIAHRDLKVQKGESVILIDGMLILLGL